MKPEGPYPCENCGELAWYPCFDQGCILCNNCYEGILHEHDYPDEG